MTYETDHQDDVYVEREGTGMGTILGIILAIVVVLAIIWFFFLGGLGQNNTTTPVEQEAPAEVQPPVDEVPVEPVP